MQKNQSALLFSSAHSATFYTSGGIHTEVRSGYLLKSPPQNKFKTEVTELDY